MGSKHAEERILRLRQKLAKFESDKKSYSVCIEIYSSAEITAYLSVGDKRVKESRC